MGDGMGLPARLRSPILHPRPRCRELVANVPNVVTRNSACPISHPAQGAEQYVVRKDIGADCEDAFLRGDVEPSQHIASRSVEQSSPLAAPASRVCTNVPNGSAKEHPPPTTLGPILTDPDLPAVLHLSLRDVNRFALSEHNCSPYVLVATPAA